MQPQTKLPQGKTVFQGPCKRLSRLIYVLKGQNEGPWEGSQSIHNATELTLHQRLLTEGIIRLRTCTHEAPAAGQQVRDSGENGKIGSINVPLFDHLCNFQITPTFKYTTEAGRLKPEGCFHRLDQSFELMPDMQLFKKKRCRIPNKWKNDIVTWVHDKMFELK